jgi:hypothetical protein
MLVAIHYVTYNLRVATRISSDVFMTNVGRSEFVSFLCVF